MRQFWCWILGTPVPRQSDAIWQLPKPVRWTHSAAAADSMRRLDRPKQVSKYLARAAVDIRHPTLRIWSAVRVH